MKDQNNPHTLKKTLLRVLGAIGSLFLLAVICLVLILIAPQDIEDQSEPVVQPPLSAMQEFRVPTESDLAIAMVDFPIPVMSFLSGSGWRMTDGVCKSFPLGNGCGRTITTQWLDKNGAAITLESIYPADAFDYLGMKDFHFSSVSGPSLFSLPSVRMENEKQIRLHVKTENGLYVITSEKEAKQELGNAVRSVQLFTAEKSNE